MERATNARWYPHSRSIRLLRKKLILVIHGIRNTLFELANLLRHEVHSIPVYHSPLKQDLSQVKMEA